MKLAFRVLVVCLALASATTATAASTYYSFSAWISSSFYYSYSGSIAVTGYARFQDYDCSPSYQCERNVFAEFELRQGYGRFGRLVSRAYDETGQYGSYMRVTFRVPACRSIPRGRTIIYTALMEAVAPNGAVKTDQRYIRARSCRY